METLLNHHLDHQGPDHQGPDHQSPLADLFTALQSANPPGPAPGPGPGPGAGDRVAPGSQGSSGVQGGNRLPLVPVKTDPGLHQDKSLDPAGGQRGNQQGAGGDTALITAVSLSIPLEVFQSDDGIINVCLHSVTESGLTHELYFLSPLRPTDIHVKRRSGQQGDSTFLLVHLNPPVHTCYQDMNDLM